MPLKRFGGFPFLNIKSLARRIQKFFLQQEILFPYLGNIKLLLFDRLGKLTHCQRAASDQILNVGHLLAVILTSFFGGIWKDVSLAWVMS